MSGFDGHGNLTDDEYSTIVGGEDFLDVDDTSYLNDMVTIKNKLLHLPVFCLI